MGHSEGMRRQKLIIGVSDSLPKMVTYRVLEPLLRRQTNQADLSFVCRLLLRLSHFELDLVLTDTPVPPGTPFKAFHHLLGESGISFFASPELAQSYRPHFPDCLAEAPMLLPSENTVLRRHLEAFFATRHWLPNLVAEFDDLALQNVFGQFGHGTFCMPTAIEADICQSLQVEVVGRLAEMRSSYYAISVERTLRQPLLMELVQSARENLFGNKKEGVQPSDWSGEQPSN
jgi:LysR family transcriptional activator of nhaA